MPPKNYPEHLNLFMTAEARMLIEAGKPEDALGVMKTALAEQPDDVSLAYDTAMIAQNVGHFEETESILKDILSDDPDHVQAGNALAYLWVTRDMNLPEARRLLEHAYRLSPVDPYVLDSMGWLCFKEGRYDQAAEFTLASLKRLFDVEVACHLVEILAVSGRDHEARSSSASSSSARARTPSCLTSPSASTTRPNETSNPSGASRSGRSADARRLRDGTAPAF